MQQNYMYQISTNPRNSTGYWRLPSHKDEGFGFGIGGDAIIMTGMNPSVEKTLAAIKHSALVFVTGEMDETTYFELGLAIALGKKNLLCLQRQR